MERVALKFQGDGPLRSIVVEANHYGKVRGYVSVPDVEMPPNLNHYDVGRAIGFGTLNVVKDLRLKELYEGIVPLTTGEIDADIALYLNQSEQTPSIIQLSEVLNDDGTIAAAGGLLIQVLPDQDKNAIHLIAEQLAELPPLAELYHSGKRPEDVIADLFAGNSYVTLEKIPLNFQCSCSRERAVKAIISLGSEELGTLITEGEATVDCHFCHERYVFDRGDLRTILEAHQP